MAIPVLFSKGYDPIGGERAITAQEFAAWGYGNTNKVADIRAWIRFKRDAALAGGWTITVDAADSVEITKTVTEIGNVTVVKTRRFFLR